MVVVMCSPRLPRLCLESAMPFAASPALYVAAGAVGVAGLAAEAEPTAMKPTEAAARAITRNLFIGSAPFV